MIRNLRAKALRKNDINDNVFKLKKNTPKMIDKHNNSHIGHICEQKEDENLYIHSLFEDDSFAIICNEFYLNFMENPKKVDLSYYSFTKEQSVMVYLYDMKKSFVGVDDIINLIEQWKSSICDAKYCIEKLETYSMPDIHIGVITEKNDVERRKRELKPILHPDDISSDVPSFIASQHKANTVDSIPKAKLLKGFDEGKVTICGVTYKYDIRMFDKNQRHDMHFVNGILK